VITSCAAWRANVRRAYSAGYANPQHRGAWGNPGIYRLPFGAIRDYIIGWPHFGNAPSAYIFSLREDYYQSWNETFFPVSPSTVSYVNSSTYGPSVLAADAAIPRDHINLLARIDSDTPDQTRAYRVHSSATPYGEGLYDAHGRILIYASTFIHTRRVYINSNITITDSTFEETTVDPYDFTYRSDATAIHGLDTKARVALTQEFHGPSTAIRDGGPYLPYERGPDWTPADGDDPEQVEFYFTDVFLRAIINGAFTASTVRNSNGTGGTISDGTGTIGTWSQSWTRSGLVTLLIAR